MHRVKKRCRYVNSSWVPQWSMPIRAESNGQRCRGDRRVDDQVHLFYCVKHMSRGEILGPLEQIVLLALVRLKSKAYGMTVRREIEERTRRNISIGAIYATLERLEAKGYVSSFTGAPTPERGGRAKRFFRLEPDGEEALRVSHEAIRKMTRGLKWRWEIT